MNFVSIVNRTRESVLGTDVRVADRWWQRARGFLRSPEPDQGEGLLLSPCRAVHMMGMKFPLDVVFVNRGGRVIALYPRLAPRRRSRWHLTARYALELPVGTIEATGTRVGDFIAWLPTADSAGPMLRAATVDEQVAASRVQGAGLESTQMRRGAT
jgi:uncharacterized membrane protein (UPF0127 family)